MRTPTYLPSRASSDHRQRGCSLRKEHLHCDYAQQLRLTCVGAYPDEDGRRQHEPYDDTQLGSGVLRAQQSGAISIAMRPMITANQCMVYLSSFLPFPLVEVLVLKALFRILFCHDFIHEERADTEILASRSLVVYRRRADEWIGEMANVADALPCTACCRY